MTEALVGGREEGAARDVSAYSRNCRVNNFEFRKSLSTKAFSDSETRFIYTLAHIDINKKVHNDTTQSGRRRRIYSITNVIT